MSVALRSSAPVRPSLRRTASLENFLDKNRGEDQIELRTTTLDNKEGVANNVASNKPGMLTNTTFLLLAFSQLTLASKEAMRPSAAHKVLHWKRGIEPFLSKDRSLICFPGNE